MTRPVRDPDAEAEFREEARAHRRLTVADEEAIDAAYLADRAEADEYHRSLRRGRVPVPRMWIGE